MLLIVVRRQPMIFGPMKVSKNAQVFGKLPQKEV